MSFLGKKNRRVVALSHPVFIALPSQGAAGEDDHGSEGVVVAAVGGGLGLVLDAVAVAAVAHPAGVVVVVRAACELWQVRYRGRRKLRHRHITTGGRMLERLTGCPACSY